MIDDDPLPLLFRTTGLGSGSREATRLRRAAAAGRLRRLHPGSFVARHDWDALTPRRRHVLLVESALGRTGPRHVVSHLSAAALLGSPVLRDWPDRVHVTDPDARGAQSTAAVVKHPGPLEDDEVSSLRGTSLTTPARTAADLALGTRSLDEVTVVVDDLLHRGLTTKEAVLASLDRRPRARGQTGARRALAFADDRSESAGESLTRVLLHQLGAPAPVLQRRFELGRGRWDPHVDFWFPEQGCVLEFDGVVKYTQSRWRGSLTPEQVVVKEKIREDAIRARPEVHSFVRCTWWHLGDPRRLRTLLVSAGVPCSR
ncbi:hypothetical protein ES689_13820 [Frigoribacterium sp. ACAM 257]|uniref:hypothetical protein n=1 Tax=Frigoribacterium sp. ACAM 257 TaxID=2508998 RepID=UPI0011B99B42|nr:hypothetical protein [Frigoribacterium sp. ACAM 257]TWX35643.1 hypothetical protein ES689_13820 [Frigoribacterium sp. ACAM 257]